MILVVVVVVDRSLVFFSNPLHLFNVSLSGVAARIARERRGVFWSVAEVLVLSLFASVILTAGVGSSTCQFVDKVVRTAGSSRRGTVQVELARLPGAEARRCRPKYGLHK